MSQEKGAVTEERHTASSSDHENAPQYYQEEHEMGVTLPPLYNPEKSFWQRLWPAMACGAGLFSDGYLQSVIGPVNTILGMIYMDQYKKSPARQNITAIAFVGTVVGQLFFGFTSDRYSRKWSLLASTIILFVFAALSAGAYGAGGNVQGLFAALTAYRFLIGIGIGGEYPAGSVGCAESTGELKEGTRNRWFVMFTNVQLDVGFVVGTLVPMIIAAIAPNNLGLVWRLSLGLGIVPPLSLLYLRLKLKEPESYSRESFKKTKTPYWLALKYYGPRLVMVATIWFIYDFLTYPFSLYSSTWISVIQPDPNLWQTFGWSTLVNLFYVPGAIAGAWVSDWLGPRKTLGIFVFAQAVVGFLMSGTYGYLKEPQNIGGFVVVYGIFLMLGEVGPGDNIGLVASKTCATGVRGQYYAIAAATGKIGGFVGTYLFPLITDDGGGEDTVRGGQYPFFVASSLAVFSAFLVYFLPEINQNTIEQEDIKFRAYLEQNGFDTTQMGNEEWREKRQNSVVHVPDVKSD